MYAGSITLRPTSSCVPAPLRSLVSRTFGCQSTFAESAASFALSPGCRRHVLDREVLVEAHLEALVGVERLPVAQPDAVRLFRRQPARCRRSRRVPADVVDPLARAQEVVRAGVVRLPHRAAVRREREAADAHLVPDEPGRDRDRSAREHESGDESGRAGARQAPGDVQRAEDRQKNETGVAEHRDARDELRGAPRATGVGRSTTSSVSRTSAAATSWSTISRLTCTSCQTRYGFSVAIAAATRPARRQRMRDPIS